MVGPLTFTSESANISQGSAATRLACV